MEFIMEFFQNLDAYETVAENFNPNSNISRFNGMDTVSPLHDSKEEFIELETFIKLQSTDAVHHDQISTTTLVDNYCSYGDGFVQISLTDQLEDKCSTELPVKPFANCHTNVVDKIGNMNHKADDETNPLIVRDALLMSFGLEMPDTSEETVNYTELSNRSNIQQEKIDQTHFSNDIHCMEESEKTYLELGCITTCAKQAHFEDSENPSKAAIDITNVGKEDLYDMHIKPLSEKTDQNRKTSATANNTKSVKRSQLPKKNKFFMTDEECKPFTGNYKLAEKRNKLRGDHQRKTGECKFKSGLKVSDSTKKYEMYKTSAQMCKLAIQIIKALNTSNDKLVQIALKVFTRLEISASSQQLVPHFLLIIKVLRGCTNCSKHTRALAQRCYSICHAMYGIPDGETFESVFISQIENVELHDGTDTAHVLDMLMTNPDESFDSSSN